MSDSNKAKEEKKLSSSKIQFMRNSNNETAVLGVSIDFFYFWNF